MLSIKISGPLFPSPCILDIATGNVHLTSQFPSTSLPHNKWYLNTSRPMLFLRKHTVLDIYHSTPIMTQRLYHISPKILEPLLNQARPPLLARNIHPQNCGTFLESRSHCFPSLTTLLCYPSCLYFPKCRGLNSKVLP